MFAALLAALLLVAGGALRLRTAPEAMAGPQIRLYEADPYLHLRRAVQLWNGAPGLGYTDAFQNFPDAQTCSQLPVGFAALMSLAGHLAPGADPAQRIALGGGVVAVPLLGLLAAFLVWRLARKRGEVFGLWTLAAVALLPIAVDASMAGRMDHHVLDVLAVVGMLLALARLETAQNQVAVVTAGALAGLVAAAALASYPSALVSVAVTLAAAPVAALAAAWAGARARPFAVAGVAAGLTAGALGLAFHLFATPCAGSHALLANTWLPPVLALVVSAVSLAILPLLPDGLPPAAARRRVLAVVATGTLLPLALLLLLPPARAWLDVLQGQFAGKLTTEWAPLWQTTSHWWSGKLSWAFVVIPVGWLLLARQALRLQATPVMRLLAAHVWLVAPAFAVQAKYFSHLAAIALCLGLATVADALCQLVAPMRARTRRLAAGLAVVVLACLVLEPAKNYRAKSLVWASTTAVTEVLDWLKVHTPPVNAQQPEWGVLSLWSNGFWIAALADRPTYTNNFVAAPEASIYVQHILDSFAWLYLSDPHVLLAGMDAKRLRYLLTTPSDAHEVRAFQSTTHEPIAGLLVGAATDPHSRLGPAFQESNLVHLVLGFGTATERANCIDGLQLVAGSTLQLNLGSGQVPAVQLYKRVPGARLTAHQLPPGIQLRIGTRRVIAGQTFAFDCLVRADSLGNVQLHWPYPSGVTGQVVPNSPILVWRGADPQPATVEVSETAVETGAEVPLVLPAGR